MSRRRGHCTASSAAELLPAVDATGREEEGDARRLSPPGLGGHVEQSARAWESPPGRSIYSAGSEVEKKGVRRILRLEEARRGAQILLVSEVANAYLALAADREKFQFSRSTLEAQQASYNVIRRRFEDGLAQALDFRQAQTPGGYFTGGRCPVHATRGPG